MTKDELKEKLRSAYTLQRLVDAGVAELQNLRDSAGKITPAYSLAPGGCGTGQRIENDTAKIVDLENTLMADKKRLTEAIAEIKRLIAFVDEPLLNRILVKRYLQYEKWEQIAVDLNYSCQWVHKMHGKALKEILKKNFCIKRR